MDNRENQEQKSFAPAAYMRPQQTAAEQTAIIRKRSAAQALTAPVVYEPSGCELRTPSVKPVAFQDGGKGRAAHSVRRFIILSILLGVASGILLLVLHEQNQLLSGTDVSHYDEVGMTIHCLVWGGVLGLVYSMILSFFLSKVSDSLPLYAMLLFLPVLLFMLTPLLTIANELIKPVIYVLLYLAVLFIGLFFGFSFFCGG